jgi:hypothetical protein
MSILSGSFGDEIDSAVDAQFYKLGELAETEGPTGLNLNPENRKSLAEALRNIFNPFYFETRDGLTLSRELVIPLLRRSDGRTHSDDIASKLNRDQELLNKLGIGCFVGVSIPVVCENIILLRVLIHLKSGSQVTLRLTFNYSK